MRPVHSWLASTSSWTSARRRESFHYEVRATYDTPEVAENRRIVADAQAEEPKWENADWKPDDDDGGTKW